MKKIRKRWWINLSIFIGCVILVGLVVKNYEGRQHRMKITQIGEQSFAKEKYYPSLLTPSPNGKYYVEYYNGGKIMVFNSETKQEIFTVMLSQFKQVPSIYWDQQSTQFILLHNEQGTAIIYNIHSNQLRKIPIPHANSFYFSPNGDEFVAVLDHKIMKLQTRSFTLNRIYTFSKKKWFDRVLYWSESNDALYIQYVENGSFLVEKLQNDTSQSLPLRCGESLVFTLDKPNGLRVNGSSGTCLGEDNHAYLIDFKNWNFKKIWNDLRVPVLNSDHTLADTEDGVYDLKTGKVIFQYPPLSQLGYANIEFHHWLNDHTIIEIRYIRYFAGFLGTRYVIMVYDVRNHKTYHKDLPNKQFDHAFVNKYLVVDYGNLIQKYANK